MKSETMEGIAMIPIISISGGFFIYLTLKLIIDSIKDGKWTTLSLLLLICILFLWTFIWDYLAHKKREERIRRRCMKEK